MEAAKECFDPRRAPEISKNTFRWPKIEIFGPCWVWEIYKNIFGSFKMSIFGPVPGMRTMRFRAKSLTKYENTWLAACPSRIAKNVPTVFVFYCKKCVGKSGSGPPKPQNETVEAAPKLRKCRK